MSLKLNKTYIAIGGALCIPPLGIYSAMEQAVHAGYISTLTGLVLFGYGVALHQIGRLKSELALMTGQHLFEIKMHYISLDHINELLAEIEELKGGLNNDT